MDLITRLLSLRPGLLIQGQQTPADAAEQASAAVGTELRAPSESVARISVPVRLTIKIKPPLTLR